MKIRTLGLLSVVSMTLTCATVWSFTSPKAKSESPPDTSEDGKGNAVSQLPFQKHQMEVGNHLTLLGRLGHSTLLASEDVETFAYFEVKPDPKMSAVKAPPISLAIVIDRSGSMMGKRLDSAIRSAQLMVERLNQGDVLSVIAYDDKAETVLPPTVMDGLSKGVALAAIKSLQAQGNTCISCGLLVAHQVLQQRPGMVQRIMLLSDGEPTTGDKSVFSFQNIGIQSRKLGIPISSFGVDVEYNDKILNALAIESNGKHYFINRPELLNQAFLEEEQSMKNLVTNHTELQLTFPETVSFAKVFDRAFHLQNHVLSIPLGSISRNETKTVLVKLRVPKSLAGEQVVLNARLVYRNLLSGEQGNCEGKLSILRTDEPKNVTSLDPVVQSRLLRSETASILLESNKLVETGRTKDAVALLRKARTRVANNAKVLPKAAAPQDRSKSEKSLREQQDLLKGAEDGFAKPPTTDLKSPFEPGRPSSPKKQAAQIRRNSSDVTVITR
jgi:Ca-activated chloride channel homolog